MTKKHKASLGKAVFNVVLAIPTVLRLTKRIASLLRFEARIAGRSLVTILILSLCCVILLTTSWLCVLAIVFFYLLSHAWSIPIICLMLLVMNVIGLLIVLCMLSSYKKRLLFPETRYLIEETRRIYEEL